MVGAREGEAAGKNHGGASGALAMFGSVVWVLVTHAYDMGV